MTIRFGPEFNTHRKKGTQQGGPRLKAPTLVSEAGSSSIQLSWNDVASETFYELWRSFNGAVATLYTVLGPGVNSYLDSLLADGTYVYLVRAANPYGYSDFSNQTSDIITSPPAEFDYIVATTGSDVTGTGSISQPFATITHALEVAYLALAGSGKSIGVRAGTYTSGIQNLDVVGTSWTNRLRVANFNGESVTIRPNSGNHVLEFGFGDAYVEFDGFHIDGTNCTLDTVKINNNVLSNPHHIRVKNCTVTCNGFFDTDPFNNQKAFMVNGTRSDCIGGHEFQNITITQDTVGQVAFYIECPFVTIEDCIITAAATGVQLVNSNDGFSHLTHDCIVRRNIIRDVRDFPSQTPLSDGRKRGIIFRGDNNKIYANLIYRIEGTNIAIYDTAGIHEFEATNGFIYNNTVYDTTKYGILLDAGSSITVRNNISYANPSGNYVDTASGTTASNNVFASDPLFVDAGSDNFHTQAGSPARNAGQNLGTSYSPDLAGVNRPTSGNWDCGVYQDS